MGRGKARTSSRTLGFVTVWAGLALLVGCSEGARESGPGREGLSADPDSVSTTSWSPELRDELLAMREHDQEVREGFGPEAAADTAFVRRLARADTIHTRRLSTLVDSLGWPSVDDVGREGLEAAFLLVQHSTDPAFQKRMLPEVEADVRAGRLNPQDYALLVDRTRQSDGLLQLYGTQLSMGAGEQTATLDPIEDSSAVDARREELGLPSLSWYLDIVEEQTGLDVVGHEPAPDSSAGEAGGS